MTDKIEVGDIVEVNFTSSQSIHRATVLYVPCATGDSWTLDEMGHIINVVIFERMDLVVKGAK
jgi:hypothetical protein